MKRIDDKSVQLAKQQNPSQKDQVQRGKQSQSYRKRVEPTTFPLRVDTKSQRRGYCVVMFGPHAGTSVARTKTSKSRTVVFSERRRRPEL